MVLVVFQFSEPPKLNKLQLQKQKLISQFITLNKEFTRGETLLSEISYRDDNFYRVITEANPIPKTIRESGFGGSESYKKYESFKDADIIISAAKRIDKLSKQAYIQSKSYDDVLLMARDKEKKFESSPAISPISKEGISYISDYFGYRMHPIYNRRIFHLGVDLAADKGTPIHAPGDGMVEELNYASQGFGKFLTIDHRYGYKTIYGHLSRFNVKQGQVIKRGDIIAFVGNAGTSSGSHLHYGVLKDGVEIDPFNFFTLGMLPEEYNQIIAKSNSN